MISLNDIFWNNSHKRSSKNKNFENLIIRILNTMPFPNCMNLKIYIWDIYSREIKEYIKRLHPFLERRVFTSTITTCANFCFVTLKSA